MPGSRVWIGLYCATVAALAGIAAAVGIIMRGDGTTAVVTSPRGGEYEIATNGMYALNAQRVIAEGIGWDVFTLLVAVPVTLIAAALIARGSTRALLVGAGMLAYFVYAYLEYSVTWAFGPLFLLFVVIYGSSLIGLVWVGTEIATSGVAIRIGSGFPRRSWVTLSVTMAVLLTVLWLGRIWQALGGAADELLFGHTTMTVQALDLGLVVPLTLLIAWLTWRRTAAGYVLSAAWVVTFTTLSLAIVSMLISAAFVEGVIEAPPIVIFGLAGAGAGYLAARMYRSIAEPIAPVAVPEQLGTVTALAHGRT